MRKTLAILALIGALAQPSVAQFGGGRFGGGHPNWRNIIQKSTLTFTNPVTFTNGVVFTDGVTLSTPPVGSAVATTLPIQGEGTLVAPIELSTTTVWTNYATWTFRGTSVKEGLNINHIGPNPSAPTPGGIWYDATTGELKYRSTSVVVSLPSPTGIISVQAIKGTPGSIMKFKAVYITGYDSINGVIEVEEADNDNAVKFPPIGLTNQTITAAAAGTVMIHGTITGINTNSLTESAPAWLDSTAGGLTDVRPSAVNERVAVLGRVLKKSAASGEFFVSVNYADEAFPNVVPVDITVTGRINGVLDQGAKTQTEICALTCPATPCRAWSTTDFDLYTATGTAVCQYRNTRTGIGPLP